MIKYKITILTLLKNSIPNFIVLILFGVFCYYRFFNVVDNVSFEKILNTSLALFYTLFFYVIFSFIFIFNHYKYDKDTCLIIDEENQKLIYQYKNSKKEISISDISLIKEYYMPIVIYSIYYYQMYFKDGSSIYISDLLMPELDIELQDIKFIKEGNYLDMLLHRK